MSEIGENLKSVEERIAAACARAGRKREEVTLVAVSKTKPVSDVREAIAAGQLVFGENRVQELTEKYESIGDAVQWHLIGTLQSNKVKYLPGKVAMIHSVDNEKTAAEIEKRFAAYGDGGLVADVLVEVNMAHEETKMGLAPEDAEAFIRSIASHTHLNIRGLMTIAPFTEDAESNRVYFRGLRELMENINNAGILAAPMTELSMGMTGDFEVAIEEGATFVRVGTAIFGGRG